MSEKKEGRGHNDLMDCRQGSGGCLRPCGALCLRHAWEFALAEIDRYRAALEACRTEAHNDWRVREIVDDALAEASRG